MILAALLSIPMIPLILALAAPKSEAGLEINVWQIVQTLVTVQLIPISIGMAVRQTSVWTVCASHSVRRLLFLSSSGSSRLASSRIF